MTVRPTQNAVSINDFSDKVNVVCIISILFYFFTYSGTVCPRTPVHKLYLYQFHVIKFVYALGRSDVKFNFLTNTAPHPLPCRTVPSLASIESSAMFFKAFRGRSSISSHALIPTFDHFLKFCCITPCILARYYDNVSRTSATHFTACATNVFNNFTYNIK